MNIGEVIDIRLLYDEAKNTAVTPVLIALEPDRIDRVTPHPLGPPTAKMLGEKIGGSLEPSLASRIS